MIRTMVGNYPGNDGWSRWFMKLVPGDYARGLRREGGLILIWNKAALKPGK